MQTLTEIRAILESAGLAPQKAFGQNFLIDLNLLAKLVELAGLTGSQTVLEVGPGTGSLSEELLERCGKLVCVEIDRGLGNVLADRFAWANNFRLIRGDVLAGKHELSREVIEAIAPEAHLVSNLPYNIATPLLAQCLIESWRTLRHDAALQSVALDVLHKHAGETPAPQSAQTPAPQAAAETPAPQQTLCRFARMTFTVQRELADRLLAGPGGETYGPVSILVSLLGKSQAGPIVPASAFWPRPNVASRMMRIDLDVARSVEVLDIDILTALLSAAFAQRRKQIGSLLRRKDAAFAPDALAAAMAEAAIDQAQRPEQIATDQYRQMANALKQMGR